MAQATSMKQLGARNVGCVVEHMEWSNKMDLIAIGNDKGEVLIQRLNWQKIVTFPTLSEGVKVCSLSWHSDEPILAVGYSNGKVGLLDVEREDAISYLTYDQRITKISFSKVINIPDYKNAYRKRTDPTYEAYLPPLPPLASGGSYLKSPHQNRSFAKAAPCFLIVLLSNGVVEFFMLGSLKTGILNLADYVEHRDNFAVYDVRLSYDFNALYALVRDNNSLRVLHFSNSILNEILSPMLHLSLHWANILELKGYINDTIQCMSEAWDTVLMEMDNKLTKYANQQPDGSISADFLELLAFGYATLEIEEFLMDQLTEKGVKKLATSVELSCSTVQNLVVKQLQSAANNLFYFLNTIKGLSRIEIYFEPLLSSKNFDVALQLCGSFLYKIQELQQVIDQCVNDMKLFFGWLCVVIIRLRQEDVPEEMQLTAEDIMYLANYLNSFEDSIIQNEDGTVTKRKFNLEKVSQYLENRNLHQIIKSEIPHLWEKLLEENECLNSCGLLFAHNKQTSLIQERDRLFNYIDELFVKPNDSISSNFKLDGIIKCTGNANDDLLHRKCSFISSETTQRDYLVALVNPQECLVLEFNRTFCEMKSTRIQLHRGPFTALVDLNPAFGNLTLIDIQFYNENFVSMLLQNLVEKSTHFMQFPLELAKSKSTQHTLPQMINLSEMETAHSILDSIDNINLRHLDGICTHLAVSGSRKVTTILSEGCSKMTIFEMEIEDDEDETEMSQTSFLEISKESNE